jgi:hypothetical protein
MCTGWLTLAPCDAKEWTRFLMPQQGNPSAGFKFIVDVNLNDAPGYFAVRWTAVADAGSFPGNRTLQLSISPSPTGNVPRFGGDSVQAIEIKSGVNSLSGEFYVPKFFEGGNLQFTLSDLNGPLAGYQFATQKPASQLAYSGVSVSDLVPRMAVLLPTRSSPGTSSEPSIPDLRSLDTMFFPNVDFLTANSVPRLDDSAALDHLRLRSFLANQVIPANEAHNDWRGYESSDIVLASFSLLQSLRESSPDKYAAIRQWVSCGGTLWAYGVASEAELARFFQTQPEPPSPDLDFDAYARAEKKRSFDSEFPRDEWILRELTPNYTAAEQALVSMAPGQLWQELQTANHPLTAELPLAELRQQVFRVPLEAGVVVGLSNDDPFPGSHQIWHTAKFLSGRNQIWRFRRSTSLVSGTSNYWTWLIDGVAQPPVYAFLTLLTLFVLFVGPVSYYWTQRIGKSHLMFLLAPILASLTTIGLFAYGLIADGLGAQARVRQITWLDCNTGLGSRQSRSTFFTAFRNPEGLQFSRELAVYPVYDQARVQEAGMESSGNRERRIDMVPNLQVLQGDFLPPRSQQQFLTYQPLTNSQHVRLKQLANQTLSLQIDLDSSIDSIILCDQSGKYWQATGIAKDTVTIDASPLAEDDVSKTLRDLYMREQPETPLGYTPSNNIRRRNRFFAEQSLNAASSRSWSHPNDELGIYEGTLRTMLLDAGALPPGWFVAIAPINKSALVIDAELSNRSVHYIMGTWK